MLNRHLSAEGWNSLVGSLSRSRFLEGSGVRVQEGLLGQVVSMVGDSAEDFVYPWKVDAVWSFASEQYLFTVNPGFVNGKPAQVGMAAPNDPKQWVFVEITDAPNIPISNSRWVDATEHGVSDFFKAKGVIAKPTAEQEASAALAGDILPVAEDGRTLLKCDVALTIPKLLVNGELTGIGDEVLYSYTVSGQSVDVRQNRAKLVTYGNWVPPGTTADVLDVGMNEPTADELLVATIYLLGPDPNAPEANVVSGFQNQYDIFVENHLFWNLGYVPFTQLLNYQGVTITPRTNLTGALDALGEISRLEALMSLPFGVKPPSNVGYFWTM